MSLNGNGAVDVEMYIRMKERYDFVENKLVEAIRYVDATMSELDTAAKEAPKDGLLFFVAKGPLGSAFAGLMSILEELQSISQQAGAGIVSPSFIDSCYVQSVFHKGAAMATASALDMENKVLARVAQLKEKAEYEASKNKPVTSSSILLP